MGSVYEAYSEDLKDILGAQCYPPGTITQCFVVSQPN